MNEHDEYGCTTETIIDGRLNSCRCPAYRPVTGEPALFDLPAAQAPGTGARAAS